MQEAQLVEGVQQGGGLGKKMVIKIDEAEELVELTGVGGAGKVLDGVDLGWQGGDAGGVNAVAEAVQVGVSEQALLQPDNEVVFLQALKEHRGGQYGRRGPGWQ